MSLYKNKYRNESARLAEYDYSIPGYYFVTVCTHGRNHLFGEIDNDVMDLNEYGKIVRNEWDKSFAIRPELVRDEFVVMPNHCHGIVKMGGTHGRAYLQNGECISPNGRGSQQNGECISPNGRGSQQNGECISPNGRGSRQDGECISSNGRGSRQNGECISSNGRGSRQNG